MPDEISGAILYLQYFQPCLGALERWRFIIHSGNVTSCMRPRSNPINEFYQKVCIIGHPLLTHEVRVNLISEYNSSGHKVAQYPLAWLFPRVCPLSFLVLMLSNCCMKQSPRFTADFNCPVLSSEQYFPALCLYLTLSLTFYLTDFFQVSCIL